MAVPTTTNWNMGTSTGSSTFYTTITGGTGLTSSTDSVPEPEFPDWAEEGNMIIDNDDNDWIIVGQFVDEDGTMMLELESEDLGEAEKKLDDVEAPW